MVLGPFGPECQELGLPEDRPADTELKPKEVPSLVFVQGSLSPAVSSDVCLRLAIYLLIHPIIYYLSFV